jgi:NAD(P)-dependent dehydrogenase (short-subunit alcohol dehydrogenase family)
MVKKTVDTYGRIDILYNNAGISGKYAFTAETTEDEWDLILNINLKSVFLGSKYAIPVMLEQGGGVIVNTASTAALSGSPSLSAYSASKAGVVQLTKTMAMEYGKGNIRVNCICPGAVHTPMLEASPIPLTAGQALPIGRIGQPDDIARAALYLASDDSSFITGQALVVDGGFTAGIPMPRLKAK